MDPILTFEEAAAILKCSVRTIERMVTAEPPVLEQRGKGRLRRITGQSVQCYIDGEVVWNGAHTAKETPARAVGGGRVVLLDRLPKGKRKA